MKNKYLVLIFSFLIFSIQSYSQLQTGKIPVNDNVSYSDVNYSYNAYVDFRVKVQGALEQDEIIVYRNVEQYEINSYSYKGIDASEVGYSYPILIGRYKNKVYVDVKFYKGNRVYTAKGLEPDGSYYLRDNQKKDLYATFNIDPKKKECITCPVIQEVKSLNIKALNIRLSELKYLNIFSEINNKIEEKLKRDRDEKRLEEEKKRLKEEEQKKQDLISEEKNNIQNTTTDNKEATESIYEKRQREASAKAEQKRIEEQRKLEEFQRFKRAQEAKIKQKQAENKAIADAATGFAGVVAGGAADGIFSGINIGLTSRDYNIGKSGGFDDGSRNILSYELGITVGRGAFSVGYVDSGEGGFVGGIDYDVLQLGKERYDRYLLRVNVSGEYGIGDGETFYGAYLNLRIFELLYLGYGIGQVEVDEPKFSGSYQGVRIGFHFNF